MSWEDGLIQFGTGQVVGTGRVFMRNETNMFPVNGIAFGLGAEYQDGNDVFWRVPMSAIRE